MKMWIDADACPKVARDLIIKTAIRTQTPTVFVANQTLQLQKSPFIRMIVVGKGFDVADDYIVQECEEGDLVISSDIPLANDALDKGSHVMNFKGHIYTKENIKSSLSMRDFMDTMRGTGVLDPSEMGGQKLYSDKDKKAFADGLNRLVRFK